MLVNRWQFLYKNGCAGKVLYCATIDALQFTDSFLGDKEPLTLGLFHGAEHCGAGMLHVKGLCIGFKHVAGGTCGIFK